jgi:hypothetical protein
MEEAQTKQKFLPRALEQIHVSLQPRIRPIVTNRIFRIGEELGVLDRITQVRSKEIET